MQGWHSKRLTHKRHIRELYGFRTITAADLDDLREWLIAEALPDEQRKSHLSEIAYERFRQQLTELIHKDPAIIDNIDDMSDDAPEPFRIHDLKTGIGATKINNIRQVAARLAHLQQIALPVDLFDDVPWRYLQQFA